MGKKNRVQGAEMFRGTRLSRACNHTRKTKHLSEEQEGWRLSKASPGKWQDRRRKGCQSTAALTQRHDTYGQSPMNQMPCMIFDCRTKLNYM